MSAERKAGLVTDRRGSAAVEFALVAPVFFLLVFGGVQLSIAMHEGNTVQWAIENAARAASIDSSLAQADVQALVDKNMESIGDDTPVTITYSKEVGPELTLARVTATYIHTISPLFLPPFNLSFKTDVTIPLPI